MTRTLPPTPLTRPTMADVAKLAGVSVASVSRAMANSPLVSEENKERVAQAVRDCGYVVNQVARGLRLQRSGLILVLVPDIANPFFSAVLRGIEEALQRSGLGVLVGNTGGIHEREAALARSLLNGGTDGVILMTGNYPQSLLGSPQAAGRIVAVSEPVAGRRVPSVTIDNRTAAKVATRHLVALGHRRIAHIAGPPGNVLSIHRREGFKAALRAAGLAMSPAFLREGSFSIGTGEREMERLLAMRSPPSAVVCANDEIAIGAIKAARERGLIVPRDLSVTGFDDIDMAYALNPALTTVRQPRQDLGRVAAEMLLALLEGAAEIPNRRLTTRLVIRDSTAAPQPR